MVRDECYGMRTFTLPLMSFVLAGVCCVVWAWQAGRLVGHGGVFSLSLFVLVRSCLLHTCWVNAVWLYAHAFFPPLAIARFDEDMYCRLHLLG